MNNIESAKGEIVMYQPDETIRLEVRVENETVWLTQQQMAELFQTTRNNITLHIGNIFKEGELDDSIVRKESLLTAADGKKYKTKLYNLDVIISVGYRVKSIRGTKFRQWANSVLKQYLLKGYAVNQRIFDIEQKMAEQGLEIAHIRDKVDFFVRSSLPPIEGIFYDGQIFDAYAQIVSLIKQAKHSIVLVDNYINVDTLTMLSNRDTSVSATIYTRQLSQQQQLDVQRYNQQYPPITINTCLHNHDRFLIVDDVVYLFGASLKDAGKKLFAYIRMQETSPADLLSLIR
ncbi:MAG: DNA-binding protein [Prevotella sp.]|nr:DNA-binding protein [Prevotella sp.]